MWGREVMSLHLVLLPPPLLPPPETCPSPLDVSTLNSTGMPSSNQTRLRTSLPPRSSRGPNWMPTPTYCAAR